MTIPASITTALTSLQNQVAAANPLASATRATKVALQLNAEALVNSIDAALSATSLLDTYAASADPTLIVASVLQMVDAAADQNSLSLMRGVVGRASSNLDQL